MSSWPAQHVESPWPVLRTVSPCRTARRPPVRAERRSVEAKAGPRRPDKVEGTALRFVEWFTPEINAGDEYGFKTGSRVLVKPYALNASLLAIEFRRQLVALTLGHGGDWLLSSGPDNDCFEVFVKGDSLRVRIRGSTRAGRRALAAIRRSGDRELSVGLGDLSCLKYPGPTGPLFVITEARLQEIAVVPAGACPRCRLFF